MIIDYTKNVHLFLHQLLLLLLSYGIVNTAAQVFTPHKMSTYYAL